MRNLFRYIRSLQHSYEPLVRIEISASAIKNNLAEFSKMAGWPIAPVLKSNAYGHGLIQVAKIIDKEQIPFIVVDSHYEAHVLRNEGITSPILIIGHTPAETIQQSRLKNITFTIVGRDEISEIGKVLTSPKQFHIKIDTGMHRQGIRSDELDQALQEIHLCQNIVISGACSHFSDADGVTEEYSLRQITDWNDCVAKIRKSFSSAKTFHIANSAGNFFNNHSLPKIDANLGRLGISLYGIPSQAPSTILNKQESVPLLKPALTMITKISGLKILKQGETVGYNNTFTAKRDMHVATIPTGYFEGIDRRLSNVGSVQIQDELGEWITCPIVGRVSMNITTIDVSAVKGIHLHSSVRIFSQNPEDMNSIQSIAKISGTIPYEILIHIPQHIRRVMVE